MSAYNVQLPGVVIAALYKKAVVKGEGKAVEAEARQESNLRPAIPTVETAAPVSGRQDSNLHPPVAGTTEAVQPSARTSPATTPVAPTASASTSSAYKFLGKNQQHVTIIVRFPGEAFLPENHLQLLTKMLGACKLNLGDVAIVNDATQAVDMNRLKEQLYPKQVLLFGVAPDETGLPLSFPMFKDQEYAGSTYLHTPSLDELNKETEEGKILKRKLWESLKKIFGV